MFWPYEPREPWPAGEDKDPPAPHERPNYNDPA
jgi:hypothetical protein